MQTAPPPRDEPSPTDATAKPPATPAPPTEASEPSQPSVTEPAQPAAQPSGETTTSEPPAPQSRSMQPAEPAQPISGQPPPPTVQSPTASPSSDLEQASTQTAEEPWTLRPPRLSGYMQVHYRHSFHTGTDPLVDNPDFRVQRVRIGIEGDLQPWLSYDVEIDPRPPLITGILRDAFITLRLIPHHRVRIGQQKTLFGYENVESSTRLYAVNRTEVSDALSRGLTLRDIGIGLIGHVPLGNGFRFEDAITVVNGAGMNVQADDTKMKDVWGRIGLRYRKHEFWARLGVSGAIGDHIDPGNHPTSNLDDFRLRFKRLGTDLEISHRWAFLSAELVYGWDDTPMESTTIYGWYVNLVGKTPWQVGPIARYDTLSDGFRRFTFGAYYDPIAALRVMVNYELRLRRDNLRADDKLYVWVQLLF